MIHYNIWFGLRGDVDESEALAEVRTFLSALRTAGTVTDFRLLRNCGSGTKTKLLPFQAQIQFQDDAQFSSTFSDQAARGIRTGPHGRVMSLVNAFHVEVFRELAESVNTSVSRG